MHQQVCLYTTMSCHRGLKGLKGLIQISIVLVQQNSYKPPTRWKQESRSLYQDELFGVNLTLIINQNRAMNGLCCPSAHQSTNDEPS